jgi:calcineurin-like phosphoesterase family protein
MVDYWFSSDKHFGHDKVRMYDNRPFNSKEEMDEALIQNWNSVVKADDIVFDLGDLTLSNNLKYVDSILKRLNGKICFIKGNHDVFLDRPHLHGRFEWIKDYYEWEFRKRKVILHHYPHLSWRNARHGSWCIHGHVHGKFNKLNETCLRIDVGCMNFNYTPVNIEVISDILTKRQETLTELDPRYYGIKNDKMER